MSAVTTQTGRYLFAVTRGLADSDLAGVPGIDGAPLCAVGYRDLRAVVCSVPLEAFGEETLARNLEDLTWLERVARAHDRVVSAAAATATVAPLRLVTICADDRSVMSRVEALYDDLSAALDRVEGRREWSVKVHTTGLGPMPDGAGARAPDAPGTGAEYLLRKKAQAERRRSAEQQSARAAEEIHARLAAGAEAARRLAPQDPQLTGRAEPMILNGAYLVAETQADAFGVLVREVAAAHPDTAVEVKGPWPPYSFATLG